MDLTKLLGDAHKAVQKAEIDPDLKAVAFEKAIEILAAQEGLLMSPPAPPPPPEETKPLLADKGDVGSGIDRIAAKLGVAPEPVHEIYVEAEGSLHLTVPSKKLDGTKSAGARQLTLLVAAGRQAGGFDEGWTHANEIRAVCKDYDKFDENNFGGVLGGMDDVFQIKGKGQSREVRMKNPGYEKAAELVTELTKRDS
jgi:hypothetical protein